ncbi:MULTISPECIES: sigma-54-dependent Fis family transcriptional regulator [unclassified Bacillus (in: firmicutes)]|uniref:sigma-54 interaction domain-containing protein n=1 Tax=unclassified Bacillus (in: firmicutes) TaxID=185979 RepID=UPI0008ECAB9E|nr:MULTISPECIES: sigma 54-interacting transcriptional regulator [unclassified Bacillus (in: firmicutes)]SFB13672.1 PAS domain S-box-containing protein [Bacillus sp. UNCCL13]SFQ89955.1 PAS domain S-box-containing protein [Bacillus sp. cl95]
MNLGIEHIPYSWLQEIINLSAERIVVVDREGVICYINEKYCEFLGTTVEFATGRHVTEIIDNTRMHIVAKTGQAEIAALHPINGSDMIANRFPLIVEGELVGALGTVMFRTPEDWWDYKRKIQPLLEELKYYKTKLEKDLKSKYSFQDLIGESNSFQAVKMLAERISGSQSAVLLLGESGTGKELFAHAIHSNSARASFPFVPINCASIPEHLLESELFGYEDGAFTGAKKGGKKGQFQIANYGTIFLDEVGDMPLPMQSKLLRVLQEKEIQRVGGQTSIPVDVRIIAATHRNLEKMVEEGKFRQDLYYRLNVIKIEIPPLRKRKNDIALIASNLLKKLEKKFHRQHLHLSREVIARLESHDWPGNIRELENVLERAINVLDDSVVELHHLPLYLKDQELLVENQLTSPQEKELPLRPLKDTMADVEKQAIQQALEVTNGNKLEAAKLLQIGKTSFYEKCKIHHIS